MLHIELSFNPTWHRGHSGLIIQCHTDTPYRQDPNLGEDKGGLLGSKKDKYKVSSLLNKAQPNFGSSAAFSCQFCQALRYQNRSKGLVCHYINIDTMHGTKYFQDAVFHQKSKIYDVVSLLDLQLAIKTCSLHEILTNLVITENAFINF